MQGDHPLTAPIWRTLPVIQAGCAVQQMSVESWMVQQREEFFWRCERATGKRKQTAFVVAREPSHQQKR